MSDLFENPSVAQALKNRTCRVAYTLNNNQPVISTIIGDEPLFYLDYEDHHEDDVFDAAELGLLEEEIRKLKSGIDSFDDFYQKRAFSEDSQYADYKTTLAGFCGEQSHEFDLQAIIMDLRASRLASAYLDCVHEHNITIQFSTQIERSFYDRDAGTISVNPNLDNGLLVLALIQELRTHWQHRNGALIQPLVFEPDHAVLINRAQRADLAIAMVRIGWELQLAGNLNVWKALESSSMADLARTFARESFLDFRTINNGIAAAAVFEAWFLSERCRTEDKALIQNMLADTQGYMFDNDEASKSLTADILAALGTQPYGKNYLAQHAVTIMNDPIFTEVRDRSNANFLWFIKFERTFRETEQQLQETNAETPHSVATPSEDDVLSASHSQKEKDLHNDQNVTADVITLYTAKDGEDSAHAAESGKLLKASEIGSTYEGDNVILLQPRAAE